MQEQTKTSNFLSILRFSAGIILLMIGIIGLLLPILQGWLLIMIAIPLISPRHGKMMVEKLKGWKERIKVWWRRRK